MTSDPGHQAIDPITSSLFCAEEGKDFVPFSCEKEKPAIVSDDLGFFDLAPSSFDIRSSFRLCLLLAIFSPLCGGYISYTTCLLVIVVSYAAPVIIRIWYPHFMHVNILDDLRIQAGATLSLFASITALLLQV